ncbi:MAG: T9SS type A sorting domain-containing protein [Chitinispirillaceae bacterium]|nr:T9SS type A sorting domain-containing protein [Chitinispirillaceae bacterium]
MVEALKKSITPEERIWFEQQHVLYRANNPVTPLIRSQSRTVFSGSPLFGYKSPPGSNAATPVKRVLILANKTLYAKAAVKEKVDRYMNDIANGHGCKVELEVLEGGTAVAIRDMLISYYHNGGLDGAIQIGSLPVAWMEFKKDPFFGNYETWTCDHFYCDLDGEWVDADNNTFYETHNPGKGDRGSEIFYARIDVAPMGRFGSEDQMCCDYLDKDHNYWIGGIELKKSAIDMIEPDWRTSVQYLERVYGATNTKILRNPGSYSRNDYVNTHIKGDYSFLHLWCHSGHTAHSFSNGGELSYTTVYEANPTPIGYAHDGCHLADWAAANKRGYLGGAYVFNKSPTALVCISGTRTGQWIGNTGKRLFEEIGKNTCVGKAYQLWFDEYCNSSEMTRDVPYFMAWNYGMLILGDPMLTFQNREVTPVVEKNTSFQEVRGDLKIAVGKDAAISYVLPEQSAVDLQLYDISGKSVYRISGALQDKGRHTVRFGLQRIPKGIYILRLRSNGFNACAMLTIGR